MGQITRTNFGLTKTRVVTNAEILTLDDPMNPTPITLISAIPGKLIVPIHAVCYLDWHANYGAIDSSAILVIGWGGSSSLDGALSGLYEGGLSKVSYLLAPGVDAFVSMLPLASVDDSGTPNSILSKTLQGGSQVGVDVTLALDNGGAALTGGNASNTLTVTVFYSVVPVS